MSKAIKLSQKDIRYLNKKKSSGNISLRMFNRINILLQLNKGKKAAEIADFFDVGIVTIGRIKNRYLEEGVEQALEEKERPGQPAKYTIDHQAEIVALAGSPCPEGSKRWSVRLLTSTLKAKPGFETVNRESVRLALKKMNVSLG